MRRSLPRHGFTLIEILVVIVIIAILAAILFPVFAKARRAAHLTACQARLYQLGQAIQLQEGSKGGYPDSLQELVDRGVVKEEMIRCPHPDAGESEYVYKLPETIDVTRQVPPGRTIAFCVAHIKPGTDTDFLLPLEGEVPFLRYPTAVGRAKASSLERWQKVGRDWNKIEETGDVPFFPVVWRFPKDPWPPEP